MDNDPSIYRISEYRLVDDNSFEGLKKAISLYGIVLAGFHGSNAGWSGEIVREPKSGEAQWNHAISLTGYEEDYIIGQNSWGRDNHNEGLFKFNKDYLPFESWIVPLDAPNIARESVQYGWVAMYNSETDGWYLSNNKTTVNLNVREEPSLSGKIIKCLPKGTSVRYANGQDTNILEDVVEAKYIWRSIIVE